MRETWYNDDYYAGQDIMLSLSGLVYYKATEEFPFLYKWKPSIHMPRWASRITLEVTDVRVERVQDISEQDALAEGVDMETEHGSLCINIEDASYSSNLVYGSAIKTVFRKLWDSINLKRGYGWDINPWVWVVEFKRAMP